jgi:hypothetical protein
MELVYSHKKDLFHRELVDSFMELEIPYKTGIFWFEWPISTKTPWN